MADLRFAFGEAFDEAFDEAFNGARGFATEAVTFGAGSGPRLSASSRRRNESFIKDF
ncbi:MAG: hypothetical protein RID07_11805 [Lacipirellulaceae bacterium]